MYVANFHCSLSEEARISRKVLCIFKQCIKFVTRFFAFKFYLEYYTLLIVLTTYFVIELTRYYITIYFLIISVFCSD